MRNPLGKGLIVAGSFLVPLGELNAGITWDEYWLRASSPSVTAAASEVAPFALMTLIGVLAFVTGAIRLGGEVRRGYLLLLGLFVSTIALLPSVIALLRS